MTLIFSGSKHAREKKIKSIQCNYPFFNFVHIRKMLPNKLNGKLHDNPHVRP